MKTKTLVLTLFLIFTFLTGCGIMSIHDPDNDITEPKNLALIVTSGEGTDVSGINFVISVCDDGNEVANINSDWAYSPPTTYSVDDFPFEEGSRHLFSSFSILLPQGCYDIEAIPYKANGDPSNQCTTATVSNVSVVGGDVTEILLVLQRETPSQAILDTKVAVNREPTITQLSTYPSNYVSCGQDVEVCITATDLDFDPMQASWEQLLGENTPLSVTESFYLINSLIECITFTPVEEGSYTYQVTVQDLFEVSGVEMTLDDWFDSLGEPHQSRDIVTFGIEASCEPQTSCIQPIDFWQDNHAYADDVENQIPWPLDEDTALCSTTYYDVVEANPSGGGPSNFWGRLAFQFIIASLNVEEMVEVHPDVLDALDEAETLLVNNCSEFTGGNILASNVLRDFLSGFNNDVDNYCE